MKEDDFVPPSRFMYCRKCKYCLYGLIVNRCPECGQPFDPGNPHTFLESPGIRWDLLGPWLRIWEPIVSVVCLVLFYEFSLRGRHAERYATMWHILPIIFLGFGVGLAVSGVRWGNLPIRAVSVGVLVANLLSVCLELASINNIGH